MKRILTITALLGCFTLCSAQPKLSTKNDTIMNDSRKEDQTIYSFKVKDIQGQEFDLASLQGKKVMIVNTASECGLTPQYKQLQDLYTEFKDKDFVIIGFPANNFGEQEPGTDQNIAEFCQANYGVTFPMMSKISVKGPETHPLYAFLTQKEQNGYTDSEVEWNFQKYLIDQHGYLVQVISPRTLPTDPEIKKWIKSKE